MVEQGQGLRRCVKRRLLDDDWAAGGGEENRALAGSKGVRKAGEFHAWFLFSLVL